MLTMKLEGTMTMLNHKTFCAFGAYAVNVIDPNPIVVMLLPDASEEGDIKQDKLVTLNLQKRINVAPWDEVIFDTLGLKKDGAPKIQEVAMQRLAAEGGINILTVGPGFLGPHLGGIYIERTKFFAEIRP